MKTLVDKVEIGEIVVGVCSGCGVEEELRFEGIQENPFRGIEFDVYSCMTCGTTRYYNKRDTKKE